MEPATAPTLSVHQFQAKWRDHIRQERPSSQEHFIDLCRLVGFRTPAEADPDGSFYTFEKGARKTDGSQGFADVWYRGRFAWEYKGRHGNLKKAYEQLQRYREDLENPRLLVVSDMDKTQVHTNFTATVKRVHEFDLESLDEPKGLDTLRAVFHNPDALNPQLTVQAVTADAAARFAELAVRLERRGVDARQAAHFLVQILFCLFAEDVGLLDKRVFTELLHSSLQHPNRFPSRLEKLFVAMRDGGDFGPFAIDWFNGGLFAWIVAEELSEEEINILVDAAALDWSSVEPAIFGTLFERSLDPDKRRQLGLQYTPRREIKRVVDAVIIEPLERRWDEVRAEADLLKLHWDSAITDARKKSRGSAGTVAGPEQARKAFRDKLFAFQDELAQVRILDPACGSGNFLYVALAALLDLEKKVSRYSAANGLSFLLPRVGPAQLAGLEKNEYARELAQVVVWIGYLQWMQDNGFQPEREPVLKPLETIELRDALLDRREGRVFESVWPTTDFIVGNPPFLGGKLLREGLGDNEVDELFAVYEGRVPRESDLVCYWFEKARAAVDSGHAKRVGLLATQGIRGGVNRRVLERIKETGDIFMAWADQEWVLNGADVRISIVGFDNGEDTTRTLDDIPVATINADLTGSVDVTKARTLLENSNNAFMGDTKGGPFEVSGDLARLWLAMPVNLNGRANRDVVRPSINGLDVTRRPRDTWIVDFGAGMSEEDAALYEAPFEYVRQHVMPVRQRNKRESYQRKWWIHAEPRPRMQDALKALSRFIVTPTVAKHRIFVWENGASLPDHALIVFARADDYFFGVLHSRAHEVWSLRTGTRLGVGNDPRYTPTTCFETFPMPWVPGQEPWGDPRLRAIGDAARELNNLRERWLNPQDIDPEELKKRTLTNLYNQRPTWLAHAHAALDRAVWAAYGWDDQDSAAMPEETILSRLLALNLERAAGVRTAPIASHDDCIIETGASQSTNSSESSPYGLPAWFADGVPAGEMSEPDSGTVQAASGGA